MSGYVGIDVHRVLDQAGEVLANRNVPNGIETVLKVIGDLRIGTPGGVRGDVRHELRQAKSRTRKLERALTRAARVAAASRRRRDAQRQRLEAFNA